MKIFLKLKHWQMFCLFFVIPVLFFQFAGTLNHMDEDNTMNIIRYIFYVILIFAFFIGWLYNMGTTLYKKIPSSYIIRLYKLKIAIIFPVCYMIFWFFVSTFNQSFTSRYTGDYKELALTLIFLTYAFIVIVVYQAARILTSAENKRIAKFTESLENFFLICLFPIGIWFIQPKVNKLSSEEDKI